MRTYDSNLKRFISVDPLYDTSSPYSYVGNNPISFIDPTGLEGEIVVDTTSSDNSSQGGSNEPVQNSANSSSIDDTQLDDGSGGVSQETADDSNLWDTLGDVFKSVARTIVSGFNAGLSLFSQAAEDKENIDKVDSLGTKFDEVISKQQEQVGNKYNNPANYNTTNGDTIQTEFEGNDSFWQKYLEEMPFRQ